MSLINYLEIISKDDWENKYKKKVKYDTNAYKKSYPKLKELFTKLNGGTFNDTIVFDYQGSVPKKLNNFDTQVISILLDLGYTVSKETYMTGVALKNQKEINVIDILQGFNSKVKTKEQMQSQYDKAPNPGIEKQLKAIKKFEDANLIKGTDIDITKLSIYSSNKPGSQKLVFTMDPRAIASQSTQVGWKSCMNLDDGEHKSDVGKGIASGTFIVYLAKAGDEFTLDSPTARVLFKPYVGKKTKTFHWKADKIYGTAPNSFKMQAQEIIDKIQGTNPSENDIYKLADGYRDDLEEELDTRSQEELAHAALNSAVEEDRLLAIRNLNDQKILAQIALNDKEEGPVRWAAIGKLEDQKVLAQLVFNDNNDHIIKEEAIERLEDQKVLAQIALKDEHYRVRYKAIEKLEDQKVLAQIALSNMDDEIWRASTSAAIMKLEDQEVLRKIINKKSLFPFAGKNDQYYKNKAEKRLNQLQST